MPKTLFILNDPPYGTERCYNAFRLACSLSKRDGEEVKVFLIGDAAACAKKDQKVPQGYYNTGAHAAKRRAARRRDRRLCHLHGRPGEHRHGIHRHNAPEHA
jgi:sulfur relay (sulfurtransferase) complex TusBCD TusD component (DsrE family)